MRKFLPDSSLRFWAVTLVIAAGLLQWPVAEAAGSPPAEGQRIVLITGSTGGLGREVARALAAAGDHVIVHGRNPERGEALVNEIEAGGRGSARFYPADFASFDQVRALAARLREDYNRLDVLVKNAGVFFPEAERRLSEDGYEVHFQVNYLSGFLLTEELLGLLQAGAPSRIVNVASGAQAAPDFYDLDMEDNYDGRRAYGQSKLAQIMMTYGLAETLASQGITINALHPSSYMDTDMVLEAGIEPRSSVETGRDAVIRLINEDVGTGKYFNVFDEQKSHPASYDADIVNKMLIAGEALTAQ